MFRKIVAELAHKPQTTKTTSSADLRLFTWYLERHIVIDGDRHGPMAETLFRRICLADDSTRKSSLEIACRVLDARIALWDAVVAAIS
jgi:hypothetical protein